MEQQSPNKNESSIEFSPTRVDAGDQKRRSSSRSIKRKRFDDEIVEYSLGIPPAQLNRVGRSRTQSQTYVASTSASTIVNQSIQSLQSPSHTFSEPASVLSPPTIPVIDTTAVETPIVSSQPVATSTAVASAVPIQIPLLSTVLSNANATAVTPSTPTPITHPVATKPSPAQQLPMVPIATIPERRRSIKPIGSAKKTKKSRLGQQLTTKDLGRWKPIDDLSLIVGIQQTNDLRIVHQGVKFSCKFTIQEMQNRWYSLLYDEPISRIAVTAMRNLHPELVESVHSKALYTIQEEELLGTIKSTDASTLEIFQELLDKNALTFYPARTAKALFNHWNLMKQYMLLPDQQIVNNKNPSSFSSLPDGDCNVHFSDQEEKINDADLAEARDDALELELALADRKCKKEIRHLENELPRWTVLVDSITGIGIHPEFDNQTLAVLRGRLVRYLMRSREITLGRKSDHECVDVDLSLEGPACKVSRRQGTIKLRSNGDFFIANEGKRPLFIDGIPLLQGNKAKLNNNCTIEIAGLRVVFMVNVELINAIRQESAKMNGPLN